MHELRLGDGRLEAVLLPEAGARLHRLRAFGHDLLRTPPDPADHQHDPFVWGGYVMAPWCNRIAAGDTLVDGRTVRLAANFPDGSVIHGQVGAIPWSVDESGTCSVRAGGDGWPWLYQLTLSAEVAGASLRLGWRMTNLADAPMPAGIGFHPWWRRPLTLRVEAEDVFASNVSPSVEPEPVSGRLDLRTLIDPPDGLDGTWTDASAGVVELAWPDVGVRAAVTASGNGQYVAVATPAGLDAVAVEPQTHAPDGLRRLLAGRKDGLQWLPPGDSLAFDLEIVVSRA